MELPGTLSLEIRTFLRGLLERDPAKRLGGGETSADIQSHPFFAKVDWEALIQRKVKPPYIPVIQSETDVQNFDTDFTKEVGALSLARDRPESQEDLFRDFEQYKSKAVRTAAMAAGVTVENLSRMTQEAAVAPSS